MADDVINEIGSEGQEIGNEFADDMFADKEFVDSEPDKKPEDGKEKKGGDKPTKTDDAGKKDGAKEDKSPKLSSFASERFLKKNEDGSSAFDAEGALGFIQPKSGNLAFKYEPKIKPAEKKAGDDQAKEPTNPYKARIEAQREHEKSLKDSGHLWPTKYSEAIRAGYNSNEAIQFANAAVKDWIDSQVSDWQWKRDQEEAEARGKSEMTTKQLEEAKRAAATNEQAYVNYFGGKEAYDRFMFGRMGKSGEYEKGYAQDFIYKQYELMNPDKLNPTPEDYSNWWNRFASDPSNLALAYTFGMGNLMMELMPHLNQRAAATSHENARQKGMAQRRAPGVQRTAPGKNDGDLPADVAQFFQPPNFEEVDTI